MQQEELKARLDDLAASIVTDRGVLDQFVEHWGQGFHDYSFGNLLLIWSQKPTAGLCAGFQQWKRVGRFVKAGEHGLAILAPLMFKNKDEDGKEEGKEPSYSLRGFRVVYVFDYSQTDGKPLDLGRKAITGQAEVSLEDVMGKFPEYQWTVESDARHENGKTDGKQIFITKRPDPRAMLSTVFHELAHAVLGHAGSDIDRTRREAEAEAVAYVVGGSVGIKNEDAGKYVGVWHGDKKVLTESGLRILKTAETILRRIIPDRFGRTFQPSTEEA